MEPRVKRPYRQSARARRAAATRASLRAAATTSFVAKGYAATTMREIAQAAGVGERTLYDAFSTKEALFAHVAGVALAGDDAPETLAQRPQFQAVTDARDAETTLVALARFSTEILERAGPLLMVAVESAGADPAMRRFCDEGEAATKANIESVVQHLVELGAVNRQRHTKQRLVATAAAVVSPHVHKLLRGDRGLSQAAYERWVEAALHMCVAMASGDDLIRMHDPSKSRPQSD